MMTKAIIGTNQIKLIFCHNDEDDYNSLIFERKFPSLIFTQWSVSSFIKSNRSNFIANNEWTQFIRPQSTGLSSLGEMLESYYKL